MIMYCGYEYENMLVPSKYPLKYWGVKRFNLSNHLQMVKKYIFLGRQIDNKEKANGKFKNW